MVELALLLLGKLPGSRSGSRARQANLLQGPGYMAHLKQLAEGMHLIVHTVLPNQLLHIHHASAI